MNQKNKIVIDIAGLKTEICSGSPEVINHIASEYSAFISEGRSIHRVDLKVDDSKDPFPEFTRGEIPLEIIYGEGAIRCRSVDFTGSISLEKGVSEIISINERAGGIQNFLRVLYSNLLLDNHGILVHSANIIKDDKGYLFFGKSGSGKTTVSRSASESSCILSDDMTVIRKTEGYRIYGSPFWGMLREDMDPVDKDARIESIFRLKKSNRDRIIKKPKQEALFDISCCISFLASENTQYEKALSFLKGLIEDVPSYDLEFEKSCNFWRMIR